MARYRTYTVEFKRQVVEEHLGGGTSLNQLARRHDLSRELLRIWVRKDEAGEFANDGPTQADRRAYEAQTQQSCHQGPFQDAGVSLRGEGRSD